MDHGHRVPQTICRRSHPSVVLVPQSGRAWGDYVFGFQTLSSTPMSIITQYFPYVYGLWVTDRRFMHGSRLELCSSTSVSLRCHWPLFQVSVFCPCVVHAVHLRWPAPLRAPLSNLS